MQQVLSLHLRTEAHSICTARAYVELSTSSAPPHTQPRLTAGTAQQTFRQPAEHLQQ